MQINNKVQDAIVSSVPAHLIEQDIENIKEKDLVYEEKNYRVFISESQNIPNILREIGRLREITFREVGEGTNKSIDLDHYDAYYLHLFVWDEVARTIVGAYRLGRGKQIFPLYNKQGFYIDSLFSISEQFNPILQEALELGRSFIIKQYQQKPLPLFLLWKGISAFLVKNPEYKYLIGPVSISNNFSHLSKSLMVEFIKRNYFNHQLALQVTPKNCFDEELNRLEANDLLNNIKDLKQLDTLVSNLEPSKSKIPILLRQYIQLNAKFIGFNIDPDFENALDGFLLLKVEDVPPAKMVRYRANV